MIVSDEDFSANLLSDYTDEPYFKLLHDLRKIDNVDLPEGFVMTQGNTEAVSYTHLSGIRGETAQPAARVG